MSIESLKRQVDRDIDRFGNTVILHFEEESLCPGSSSPYDLLKDRQYHRGNPDSPLCDGGKIVQKTDSTTKSVIEHNPPKKDEVYLTAGEFKIGDKLATVKAAFDLKTLKAITYNGEKYIVKAVHEDIYGDIRLRWILHISKGGNVL